jgi:hypothetical protein
MTLLTPHDRAAMLGNAIPYRIDVRAARELLSIVAKVNSFEPDEYGMVHLIGAHRIIEAKQRGEVIGITMVPLVAFSKSTTTRLRAGVIYSYAVAAPNIAQAFFSKMADEIAGDLDDIFDERERPHA